MKRWILILVLAAALVLLFAPAVAAQFSPEAKSSTLDLPVDVQAAGTTIPAGRYTLERSAGWIVGVGRPPASMGFYTGPQLYLAPAQGGYLDRLIRKALPVPTFHLRTAIEAKVLYDIPAREGDPSLIRRDESVATPMIKQGKLIAIVLGDRILYVTDATAENYAVLTRPGIVLPHKK